MGFEQFIEGEVPDKPSSSRYSTYGYDEREELVKHWIDELQDKFPEKVRCDMVEISPPDVKYHAKAYYKKKGDQYMRVSESVFDEPTGIVRSTVLHEMIHLFMYQNGWTKKGENSHMFKYLCGRLGAVHSSGLPRGRPEWDEVERFIDEDLTSFYDRDTDELLAELDDK